MTDQPGAALVVLAQIKAQASAGAEVLNGLVLAVEALETIIQDGLEGPFKGVFNANPNGFKRPRHSGKIVTDPELQAFIRARVTTMTFGQVAAEVAQNFPPDRHVSVSSIHRWWHRHGKHFGKAKSATGD